MKSNITVPQMMNKLDELYREQDNIMKEAKKLLKEKASKENIIKMDKLKRMYEQKQDDIELCEQMIMYQSNKSAR